MPCRGKGPSAGLQETQFPGRPPERKRCVPGVERGWWGQPGSLWTTLTAPPPPPLTVELCPGRPGRLASVTWAFISLTRLLIANPLSLWHLSVRFGGEPE